MPCVLSCKPKSVLAKARVSQGIDLSTKPLRFPRPKPSLLHLKGGSEDHSYGGPQNPADATWLQNRRVTILRYEKVQVAEFSSYHLDRARSDRMGSWPRRGRRRPWRWRRWVPRRRLPRRRLPRRRLPRWRF